MRVIYDVLPVVEKQRILSLSLPNSFNFSFDFAIFLKVTLLLYFPGLYLQYNHMLDQRSKYLGPQNRRHRRQVGSSSTHYHRMSTTCTVFSLTSVLFLLKFELDMGSFSHYYLICYNLVQTLGWSYILYQAITGPLPALSDKVIEPLYVFQGMAVLEILHSVFGLVRASPIITTIQVYSRVQLIYLHYRCRDVADQSPGLVPMVLAWSITEVVRYSYLGLHMSIGAPYFLKWLRYTLFLVLYPLGVYGEMRVIYDVLPVVEKEHILSVAMPNSFNFSFNFAAFLKFLLAIYLPGLYVQYTHMLHQRKKQLQGGGSAKKSQ